MGNSLENFIIDWNLNTKKLNSNSVFGGKSSLELLTFCLRIHQKIKVDDLLIKLNNNSIKAQINEINQLKSALEYFYHKKHHKVNKKQKIKYAGDKEDVNDIVLLRKVEYKNNKLEISTINQAIIDKLIVDKFISNSYFQEGNYQFILYQCNLYNYDLDRIKKWNLLINKENIVNEKKSFLKLLPTFFEYYFNLNSNIEKLEYWVKMYFVNQNLKYFENFIELKIKNINNELISIFKDSYFKSIKNNHLLKLKKSINTDEFINAEIKRNKLLINTKPQFSSFSYRGGTPSYYETYKELVDGNREFFDDFMKANIAGEVEAICDFIEYLENKKVMKEKKEINIKHKTDNKEELLPIEIFNNTRNYLKKNALQVNICYKHTAYDACAILLRKITEILIIELYEREEIENKIMDDYGNYFMLKKLISSFQKEKKFKNVVSRNVNEILPKIKRNGDLSAHNRKYNSRKLDIDKLSDDFRLLFEELINSIYH